jgi:hypothetical protein
MVSHIKGRTCIEGVQEQGARENVSTKGKEVTEDWRKLHNEKPHNLYYSPDIRMIRSRMMGWEEHVAHMGEVRNAKKVRKPERKKPHGRTRHRKTILNWVLK